MKNLAIRRCVNAADFIRQVADFLQNCAGKTIAKQGDFYVALSGGRTPAVIYQQLSKRDLDWAHIHCYWGDERAVPLQDVQSNYKMAFDALLSRISIPDANVHPVMRESDVQSAAVAYHQLIDTSLPKAPNGIPQFDLILLGIGEDGHTASLFPGTEALNEIEQWAVPVYVPKLQSWRVTMTYPILNQAQDIVIIAMGRGKARVVADLATGKNDYPVSRLNPAGDVHLFIDEAAASLLADR